MSGWTDERIKTLKRLWDDGYPASEIAKTLGDVTRNAVIGVVHRRGWNRPAPSKPKTGRRNRAAQPYKPRLAPKPKVRQPSGVGAFVLPPQSGSGGRGAHIAAVIENEAAKLSPPPRVQARAEAFAPLPGSTPRIWTERPFMGCAWPVGGEGADTLSCCEPTGGKSYCAQHAKRAFVASRPHVRKVDRVGMNRSRRRAA